MKSIPRTTHAVAALLEVAILGLGLSQRGRADSQEPRARLAL